MHETGFKSFLKCKMLERHLQSVFSPAVLWNLLKMGFLEVRSFLSSSGKKDISNALKGFQDNIRKLEQPHSIFRHPPFNIMTHQKSESQFVGFLLTSDFHTFRCYWKRLRRALCSLPLNSLPSPSFPIQQFSEPKDLNLSCIIAGLVIDSTSPQLFSP